MTALVLLPNNLSHRWCYCNDQISSAITNDNVERAFDLTFSYPSQSQRAPAVPTLLRMKAGGIMSTGILNLGMRLRIRLGGISGVVVADTGALTAAASLSNSGWEASLGAVLTSANGATSQMEMQGFGSFTAGLLSVSTLYMANSSPVTIDLTTSPDIVFTWQWTTATANNSTQMRYQCVDLDGA